MVLKATADACDLKAWKHKQHVLSPFALSNQKPIAGSSYMSKLPIPQEIAMHHARMVEVALMRGEQDRAIRAVDRAFEVAREEQIVDLESPITKVCSHKTVGIFEALNINTVGDLIQCSAQELIMVANLRKKTVDNIQFELAKLGFELKKQR